MAASRESKSYPDDLSDSSEESEGSKLAGVLCFFDLLCIHSGTFLPLSPLNKRFWKVTR